MRGARPLLVVAALLLAASMLAAVSRPTTGERDEATVETDATSTTSSTVATTTSTLAPVTTNAPVVTAAPPATTRAPRPADGPSPGAPSTTASPTTTPPPPPPTTVPDVGSPPPATPCGGSLPRTGGGQWRCSWADEFTGTALDARRWSPMTTEKTSFHVDVECFVDDPDNISVSNGTLKLTARQERDYFRCPHPRRPWDTRWTSGMITTFGKWSQTYGRFEVRAKLPNVKVPGVGTAFWLWPQDATRYGPWPLSGEIDFMEFYSSVPDHVIPFIHYVRAKERENGGSTARCPVPNSEQWHLYALEWTPEALTVLVDGEPCLVDAWTPLLPLIHPQPFDQPFTLSLTQALGTPNNRFDPAVTPLPATTEVDYVRVWALG